MNIQIIKALITKEVKHVKRDSSNWIVAFLLPLLLLLVFGYGISFDMENIKVDLVLEDSGKIGRDLADSYIDSKYFNVNVVYSAKEAAGNMESGRSQGIITIPESFSKNVANGRKSDVQIVSDGTDPNTASYIEGYASGIFTKWLLQKNKSNGSLIPRINIVDRLWFNPSTKTINFVMSGVLTFIISIVGTFLTSLVVAKEWERGTMEALISTPASINEIITSKIIPYFVLCVISVVFAMSYGIFVFKMPFEGSILAMTMVSSIFIMVSLLIGLIISTTAKDQFVASMGASLVTFLPAMMLSGFIFEIKSMPYWLQLFTTIFPAKYYVSSVRTICLVGDVWEVISRDVVVLLIMTTILTLILRKKLVKNVE